MLLCSYDSPANSAKNNYIGPQVAYFDVFLREKVAAFCN